MYIGRIDHNSVKEAVALRHWIWLVTLAVFALATCACANVADFHGQTVIATIDDFMQVDARAAPASEQFLITSTDGYIIQFAQTTGLVDTSATTTMLLRVGWAPTTFGQMATISAVTIRGHPDGIVEVTSGHHLTDYDAVAIVRLTIGDNDGHLAYDAACTCPQCKTALATIGTADGQVTDQPIATKTAHYITDTGGDATGLQKTYTGDKQITGDKLTTDAYPKMADDTAKIVATIVGPVGNTAQHVPKATRVDNDYAVATTCPAAITLVA